MKKPTSQKRWDQMTSEELAAATREYDVPETTPKPVRAPQAEKKRLARFMSRSAAPKRVVITIEQQLLDRADAYAEEKKLSRSELIARGLELAINGSAK